MLFVKQENILSNDRYVAVQLVSRSTLDILFEVKIHKCFLCQAFKVQHTQRFTCLIGSMLLFLVTQHIKDFPV